MTEHEEKAKELVQRFEDADEDTALVAASWRIAKVNALIATDELIQAFKGFSIQEHGSVHIDYGHGYWEKVRQEIREMK